MWQSAPMRFLPAQVELNNRIRAILMNHNRWIRTLIGRILFNINSGAQAIVQQRLETISVALTDLFTEYYGEETAKRIQELYTRYTQAVASMAHEYNENDTEGATEQRAILYSVADDLARLASNINRFWDFATMQTIIRELVNTTEDQIVSMMTGNYIEDADQYDSFMDQVARLADEMTHGMLKQFHM